MMMINENFDVRIESSGANALNNIKLSNIRETFRIYSSKVSWIVFLFICFFTLG